MSIDPEAAPDTVTGRLLTLVEGLVAELRSGAPIRVRLDSELDRDLGLDSLARVELLSRIERGFAVRLPENLLETAATLGDLRDAIERAAPRAARHSEPMMRAQAPAAAEGLPESAEDLVAVLRWHVARHPERCHVSFYRSEDETETLTYGELAAAAERVAGALVGLGVAPGQRVAMMLPSGLDFFRCFVGILMARAVPVPMYPPARPAQLEDHLRRQAMILKNCEAPVLITFDAVRPLLRVLKGLAPALARITTPQDLAGGAPAPATAADREDLALLQYTSGSTGDPKGVTLSHANLLANIRAWGNAVQVTSTDVCVSWLPLYHDMGLIGAWLGSLYHACPLVLMSPLDFLAHPERWLRAIHRHRGTVTAAPNFAFDLCLKRLPDMDLDGLDLSSWRLAANGAEPVSPDTLERFAAAFGRYGLRREILAPVYGLAECTVGLAVPPPGRGLRIDRIEREAFMTRGRARPASGEAGEELRFVSCGPPLPGHEVRIVDAKGAVLPERSVGVLEFRGPSATAGYYRNPEATRRLLRDGWLDSGDYAYLADGEIYITGRCKDMIIRAGCNFYPYDLEQAVGELPGVRKGCVAAFGVTDAGSASERLVVVAETREQDAASRGELERRIVSVAAELLGLPPDVVVLAPPHSVLKTSSGKIRRAATRDRYLGGALGEATRAPWLQIARLGASSLAGRSRAVAASIAGRLHAAWVWAWFGALAAVAALAILLLPQFAQRWRACHRLARLFGRISGYRLTVEGLDRMPDGPCVIVANHASYIDAIVLAAALPRPAAFVGKVELRGNRLLRILLERMAVQFVERFESRRSVEDADALAAVAAQHAPLLFFAEGTFTRWPGLRPFRLGAFQAAARAGLPVVPVSLCGTRDVLRDGSWRPRRGPLSVTVSEPVQPEGEGWHGMLALRDRVRDAILEHCGEPSLDDHRVVAASPVPQAPSGSSGNAAR